MKPLVDVVTGAFGYIGKYITRELLDRGRGVRTITTHPGKPNPFGAQVAAFPYDFENPAALVSHLSGCDTLYNTYWVRFDYKGWSFERALVHTRTLFDCAREAGVRRVVHISVTNPSETDELPYYRGKALQEKMLRESGLDFRIVRPTLVFGVEDILVNNIAWTIRRFPLVPVFGRGDYRVQPVFVGDLAVIAADAAQGEGPPVLDAIGPETYTYKGFLGTIAGTLGRRVWLVRTPPVVGIALGKLIGLGVRDVVLTRDELRGLMAEKLTSQQAPNGETRFSEWLQAHRDEIGQGYTSELRRHFFWR